MVSFLTRPACLTLDEAETRFENELFFSLMTSSCYEFSTQSESLNVITGKEVYVSRMKAEAAA